MDMMAGQEAQQQTLQRDQQVAKVYHDKLKAQKKHIENYTRKLIEVRNNCEQKSLTSLQQCDTM